MWRRLLRIGCSLVDFLFRMTVFNLQSMGAFEHPSEAVTAMTCLLDVYSVLDRLTVCLWRLYGLLRTGKD